MDDVWELMSHGGYAMWAIAIFSVLALAVAIERAYVQWGFTERARALAEVVGKCLDRGAVADARSACERSSSPLADVFLVGYARLGRHKPDHVVTAVHRERTRVGQDLRARMWILGTIGATAPFVGLFGTVIGIMDAMNSLKGDVTLETVSGPISSALIVTAAGILVAVEAVVLFNLFSQRAAAIATELKLLTDEFLEQLLEAPVEPAGRGKGDGAQGDAPAGRTPAASKGAGDGDREAA
ncbi:MAG: MotA/TolQ/ExbB proton channel family protein [Kofleriaceae bacterium]|jgi:biopolymer transport protein ExbB/TolQ|nr:MotA/TolQ/ExbB proton channel family protein [Kofleriaceae bacterium]MBP9203735.1 MotA/TolQ/ExbB proton channel family protein [Kofleriaceae bacterium]